MDRRQATARVLIAVSASPAARSTRHHVDIGAVEASLARPGCFNQKKEDHSLISPCESIAMLSLDTLENLAAFLVALGFRGHR